MKKIRFDVMGFVAAVVGVVAVAFICAGCNDGGVESGGGDAVAFINRFRAGGGSYTTSFTDERDGKLYKAVKMPDGKTWMAENLKYQTDCPSGYPLCSHYNNYDYEKYGRLYDWETARTSCPSGWRLPYGEDWDNLITLVGSKPGTKLKSRDGWRGSLPDGSSSNGTDDFKFSALPGDGLYYNPNNDYDLDDPNLVFIIYGYCGYWWTNTKDENNRVMYVRMTFDDEYVRFQWDDLYMYSMNSVRCVKED
jgi:uncharacterized protein (TIGR02145 family)